jgi:hypothetical protein
VHVAPVGDIAEAATLLAPFAKGIATIGAAEAAGGEALARRLGIQVRTARIGRMQRPPLDGPVDLRNV